MARKKSRQNTRSVQYIDSHTFRHYGNQDEPRICEGEDCNTHLSIYNKFSLCSPCHKKGIEEALEVPVGSKSGKDPVLEFNNRHKAEPVCKYTVDQFVPTISRMGKSPGSGEE